MKYPKTHINQINKNQTQRTNIKSNKGKATNNTQGNSQGFPGSSEVKESAFNARDLGSIPGLTGSPEEGNGLSTAVFMPGEYLL